MVNRLGILIVPIVRVVWAVYFGFVTVLLLVPNPSALIGLSRVPGPANGRGIHFVFFLTLGVLTLAARWPVRAGVVLGLLVIYALSAETLQLLVPHRMVELPDYLENLAGLTVGAGVWWLAQRCAPSSQFGRGSETRSGG